MPRRVSIQERQEQFDAKWTPDIDGCHIWDGSQDQDGYGHFHFQGRPWMAHRWLFLQVHGFLPSVVMHHCDKPPCVRISCLIPGTVAANNADRNRKGRSYDQRGPNCAHAMFSGEEVRQIRAEYPLGVLTQSMLAEVYGADQSAISNIIHGRTYKNV
jgi:hypothetical protein